LETGVERREQEWKEGTLAFRSLPLLPIPKEEPSWLQSPRRNFQTTVQV
jgi:hypothetical protein